MKKTRPRSIGPAQQNFSFTRRTALVGGAQAAVGLVLAGRIGYIAVAENERYKLLSESNRVNLSLIPPRRGWFVDRNDKPIATNRTDFRVDIIPDRLADPDATIAKLADLLKLDAEQVAKIDNEIEKSSGFQPVQVAAGLDLEQYSAVSVRLPDLPGVVPRQGNSRYYPTGPAIGHLIGYVGTVNAEEYEKNKDPLLITPGFKIGKDNLEKQFEKRLRGKPGAARTEVTARGKIVRELETRPDVPGQSIKLTVDIDLQEYAARRLGLESGSVVVMDCLTGDILTMASMPSFDPNSFSDGIGTSEWQWLSADDHVPLRNKTLKGLYPPGSTVKPMVAMAFLEAGLSPKATAFCAGGLRVGNRFFHCHSTHGTVDMDRAIAQSCDTYFYYYAQKIGMDPIAAMARKLGLGQDYPLPVISQFYGTVPDPAWKEKKYGEKWTAADTVNSTIGQGYFLTNPLQLAVMSARLATGHKVMPHLQYKKRRPKDASLGFSEEHIEIVRNAMHNVVYGAGTAGRARLPLENVELAGKTGTAQVVSLSVGDGKNVQWKYRDHGLFICFAPFDNPRYACSVVIEHGGGSSAAYPVARDVLTFIYDRAKAMQALVELESVWGGPPLARMEKSLNRWRAAHGEETVSEIKKRTEQSAEEIRRAEEREQRDSTGTGSTSAPEPLNTAAREASARDRAPADEPTQPRASAPQGDVAPSPASESPATPSTGSAETRGQPQ